MVDNQGNDDELYEIRERSYKDSSFDSSVHFEDGIPRKNSKTIQSGNLF